MSAPDAIYIQTKGRLKFRIFYTDAKDAESERFPDETVETYHHDRVLQAANAEIERLRARLERDNAVPADDSPETEEDCPVFFMRKYKAEIADLKAMLAGLVTFLEEEWRNTDAKDVAGYYRHELSDAIETAKGGK